MRAARPYRRAPLVCTPFVRRGTSGAQWVPDASTFSKHFWLHLVSCPPSLTVS